MTFSDDHWDFFGGGAVTKARTDSHLHSGYAVEGRSMGGDGEFEFQS